MGPAPDDVLVSAAVAAIHDGAVDVLRGLLKERPSLATARIDGSRSLLHVATDWPGHRPNVAAIVAALVEAGADVNAAFVGARRGDAAAIGRRAATTSQPSTPCSTPEPTSKPRAR